MSNSRRKRRLGVLLVCGCLLLVAAPAGLAHNGPHAPGELGIVVTDITPVVWEKNSDGILAPQDPDGGGGGCWSASSWHGSGAFGDNIYFYEYQEVQWCGDGYKITSVSRVRAWTEVRGYCWTFSPATIWWNGGGIGHTSVDYRSQAEFRCEGPGVALNETVWHVPRYYGNGLVYWAGHH